MPRDSPPSYTTEVRKFQENEEPRGDTYIKKKEILPKTRPEGGHQQRYVSDEERMRGLSIPGLVNLGHLPSPMIPREDGYGDLDRQQVLLKEKVMKYPRDVNANEGYKPLARHERKLITRPMRATNYPTTERKEIRREAPQRQSEFVISPEISTAEYQDALDQAKIIARRQGREDIQEILQAVLRIRAQGKREFEKASTRQANARDSLRKETEPPRQPPDRLPNRGGAGGGGGGGGDDDPNEPDDAGDEEDDSEEEDETDSESGEGGIREQLPAELRGQRMYRLRLPLTQERQRVRNLQPNEGGGGGSSPSSSPPPSDHPQNRNPRRRRRTRRVYVLQGPVGPPGRDRRDGINAPIQPIPQPRLNTTQLNTTALEQSFDRMGQSMVEVLSEQKVANLQLKDQMQQNHETVQEQANAMKDLVELSARKAYDHMFTAVPIFDGTKPELFHDWIEQIETLCQESGRDIITELLGRAGPQVQRIIKSIPENKPYSKKREELMRCCSHIQSKVHAAKELQDLMQKPEENLRAYIHRFSYLHYHATDKVPEIEKDTTHIVKFLSSIRNTQIAKRIAEKRISEGMTLKDIFTKALELETGFQISEGVAQRRDAEVMEINFNQINDSEINEVGKRSRSPRDIVCWGCGQNGHYQRDCPYKMGNLGAGGPIDEGVVGQMQHTLITSSDITNKMMGELYKQLAAAELKGQLYKRGYKRAKASIAQSGTMTTTMTPAQTTPRTIPYVTSTAPVQTVPITVPAVMNPTVQLTRVKHDPNSTASYVTKAIKIPRGITNAKAYFAAANPKTATANTTPVTTATVKVPRTMTLKTGDKKSKTITVPTSSKAKVVQTKLDSCQSLDTIPEEEPNDEIEPEEEIIVSDTKVEDLCSILADGETDIDLKGEDSETEPES